MFKIASYVTCVKQTSDDQETVDDVLSRYAEEIDPDKIVYYGGSHGGFLGGHLIATEPR